MRICLALLCVLLCSPFARAEIVVGIAGPMGGQNATFGAELRNGVSAAISAINASGGINGESLSIVEADDGCDARRATDIANDFIGKDVRLVVGHFCSSPSLAAAPSYASAGIMMITPSATLPDITAKSLWNVFRLTGREDLQGDVAAARIRQMKQDTEVLLVSDGSSETQAFAFRFKSAMPTAKAISVKAGSAKVAEDPALLTAQSAYLALLPVDAANVARELRRLNPNIALYGPDLLQSEAFGNRAEDAGNGVLLTFLDDWLTRADPARTRTLFNAEGATLAAYAAVEVFAAAAKARNVNDSKAMAAWLSGGNEVSTIIGKIKFNASGDLQQQPYVWYRWQSGALQREPLVP